MEKSAFDDLAYKVIGCSMKVQGILGSGFQEKVYQRALSVEFSNQNISFAREIEMDIFYEGIQVGCRRVDFYVEDQLVVEIKAVSILDEIHLAQAISYCQVFNKASGLLLNFGSRNLEYKRVYNTSYKK